MHRLHEMHALRPLRAGRRHLQCVPGCKGPTEINAMTRSQLAKLLAFAVPAFAVFGAISAILFIVSFAVGLSTSTAHGWLVIAVIASVFTGVIASGTQHGEPKAAGNSFPWDGLGKPVRAILAGIGLLALTWLFPPWLRTIKNTSGHVLRVDRIGFAFLLDTPNGLGASTLTAAYAVDVPRLVLLDLIAAAATAGAFIVLQHRQKPSS